NEVGLFPAEAAVAAGLAAEMAVGRGLGIDRAVEIELGADAAGAEVEYFAEHGFELGFLDLAGAVQIDIDRQRLGDADGVAELDRGTVGETGGDDVLGEIARGVGGRAV